MSRKYDREYKLEAIRLAAEEGVSARGVEQRLGLSAGIISRWKSALKVQGDEAFDHLTIVWSCFLTPIPAWSLRGIRT